MQCSMQSDVVRMMLVAAGFWQHVGWRYLARIPLLSTILLTLSLKLHPLAHVACSIKCVDLADTSMIKM